MAIPLKWKSRIKYVLQFLSRREDIRNYLTSKVGRYILNDSKLLLEIKLPISNQGYIDYAELHQCGTLRIHGWSLRETSSINCTLKIVRDGHIQKLIVYRCYRPDIATHYHIKSMYQGFVFECFLSPGNIGSLQINVSEIEKPISFPVPRSFNIQDTHYAMLRNSKKIYHREHIYSSGLPVDLVDPQVLSALSSVNGTTLDFGCGKGALIREMRATGIDAMGIELDRREVSESIPIDMRNYITLYDGSFPLPFDNDSFDCVTCIEVLEHIKGYEKVLSEIARIARKKVIISVPDMSAIPLLAKHQVVPWHLLEATHFNFFNQVSLVNLLERYFKDVDCCRVGPVNINGTIYSTSLLASCNKL